MWTLGILLVNDQLDEYRMYSELFAKAPLLFGGFGWCVVIIGIIYLSSPLIMYVKKYSELKCRGANCEREKEKIRIRQESVRIHMEKERGEYEKEKRELKKKLKEKLEDKSELEETRRGSIIDFKIFFTKGKNIEKLIKKVESDIKDLEGKISNLDKQMGEAHKKHICECENLQEGIEKCEEQKEDAAYQIEEGKKLLWNKMKKRKVVLGMMFLFLWANGNNMLVAAQELKSALVETIDLSNESESGKSISENSVFENKEEHIEILPDIDKDLREHIDYDFILEEGQLHKTMDGDIEDIIFLTAYSKNEIGYENFLADCKKGNVIEVLPEANYGKIDLNELLDEIAEDLEKPFLQKISNGREIKSYIEWEQTVPKSTELENIINRRRQVLGMEDSISIRRTIYFRLANDYQRLGKECLIQGKDETDSYYYYGMSIYCCYCALGYEKNNEDLYSDEYILNYVKARYKDIIDNVKMEILKEKVNNAGEIYLLFEE